MKTWILAAVMMMGLAMNAQPGERHERKKHGREHIEQFTPEQKAELQAKRMTLALDLSEKQQSDIRALFVKRNTDIQKMKDSRKTARKAGKELTSDERFAMKSKMLDNRIAMKAALKKILDPGQLAKLEAMKAEHHEKITKREKKFIKSRRR